MLRAGTAHLLAIALGANHPQLLFKSKRNLDQHILARQVVCANRGDTDPAIGNGFDQPMGEDLDDLTVGKRACRDIGQLAALGNGLCLTVGRVADGNGAFGDEVGEGRPAGDKLVEFKVDRSEACSDDAPVEMFAEEREVDQFSESCLKLAADLNLLVMRKCWVSFALLDGWSSPALVDII